MSCTGAMKIPITVNLRNNRRSCAPRHAQGCEACIRKVWADVNGFDHSKTKFPLLGAHRAVSAVIVTRCRSAKKEIQFKDTSQVCEDCHKDAHDGQFAKAGKTPCADCHDSHAGCPPPLTMTPGRIFPYRAARGRACDKCHKQTRMVDAKPVIVYNRPPSKCSDCTARTSGL